MDNGLYYIALSKTIHTKHTQSVKLRRQILIQAGEFLDDDNLCARRYNFNGHLFIWMQHLFQALLSLDQQTGHVVTFFLMLHFFKDSSVDILRVKICRNVPFLVDMENNHKTFRNAMWVDGQSHGENNKIGFSLELQVTRSDPTKNIHVSRWQVFFPLKKKYSIHKLKGDDLSIHNNFGIMKPCRPLPSSWKSSMKNNNNNRT